MGTITESYHYGNPDLAAKGCSFHSFHFCSFHSFTQRITFLRSFWHVVHTHTNRESEQQCDLLWCLTHGALCLRAHGHPCSLSGRHACAGKCKMFVKNLGYPQSIVCLVGCSLVSCDATLVAKFLDINHGHQVVSADSWILQSTCCSINILVAGVLQAVGEEMFALKGFPCDSRSIAT